MKQINHTLTFSDIMGMARVRLLINRSDYRVEPGLYALGNPGKDSNVFVSANYKYSFDILRSSLKGMDAWILVLDTKGINVWCAAGKGTFGTQEIVKQVKETGLENAVNHRRLIVPQLGAPGVSAHEVKKLTGFSVTYGPIRANDLPVFLDNNMKAVPTMRQVNFNLIDRIILAPVEFLGNFRYLLTISAVILIISGFIKGGFSSAAALDNGLFPIINIWLAYAAGTIFGPALLPLLPGRSFALKGAVAGLIVFAAAMAGGAIPLLILPAVYWLLIMLPISSFLLMNFTGASTYTSLSGVRKEMKYWVPLQAGSLLLGIIIFILVKVL